MYAVAPPPTRRETAGRWWQPRPSRSHRRASSRQSRRPPSSRSVFRREVRGARCSMASRLIPARPYRSRALPEQPEHHQSARRGSQCWCLRESEGSGSSDIRKTRPAFSRRRSRLYRTPSASRSLVRESRASDRARASQPRAPAGLGRFRRADGIRISRRCAQPPSDPVRGALCRREKARPCCPCGSLQPPA